MMSLVAVVAVRDVGRRRAFRVIGAVPTRHSVAAVTASFGWNYTTVLNIVALCAAALLRLRTVTRATAAH